MTALICLLTAVNFAGVRHASLLNNVFTIGKLVPLILLVGIGVFFIEPANFVALPPDYSGFSASVLILIFAFTGFEIPGIPAGESQNPRRHLPFALLTSTAIVVVLYVAIQAVCIGTVPDLAESQRPLADAGFQLLGPAGAGIISLGALVSVTGTMNAIMLSGPRLLFAMSEQGQLPRIVGTTHRSFHTPHIAILLSAVAVLILTLSGTFTSLATLSTIIRLATYALTCAALPVLRRKAGAETALFAVRGGDIVSITALALIAWLLSNSTVTEVFRTALAAGIGLLLYASWRLRNVLQSRPS
jgi:amino acid transporter